MKVNNPVSQNIRIFPKINQKKDLQTDKFKFFKVCSFMHSILGRGSFSTKIQHQRGVAWKRSACGTAEALLSLQLVCIVGSTISHLSLENIP